MADFREALGWAAQELAAAMAAAAVDSAAQAAAIRLTVAAADPSQDSAAVVARALVVPAAAGWGHSDTLLSSFYTPLMLLSPLVSGDLAVPECFDLFG